MCCKKTIALLFLILFVAGAASAQKSYKSAADRVKIAGEPLVVRSEIYVNLMPSAVIENQTRDCSKTGTLIAPVTIVTANDSSLPKDVEIKRIWIHSDGFWRDFSFNANETNVMEKSLYTIARACPDSKLKVDKPIKVVVEIKHKGKSYFIRSSQTKLEKVF